MPIDAACLKRLARLAGIAGGYRDAWGRRREVSPETLLALLRTLGFAIEDGAAARAAAIEFEDAPWRTPLEPVCVALEGEPVTVELALAEEAGAGVVYRLTMESGEARQGNLALADMPVTARRRVDGRPMARRRLALPERPPTGYHRLEVEAGGRSAAMLLIVAPGRCYLPDALCPRRRSWSLTTQLYAVRSSRNWGMGDFSDLRALAEGAARYGAKALGVNPLHALFPAEPRHISPYSPSSRLFLNPLYIDIEAVPDFAESPTARARAESCAPALAKLRAAEFVDHPGVAGCKWPVLEALYRSFRDRHLMQPTARGERFRSFQRDGGQMLRRFAIFEMLHEMAIANGLGFSWQSWPISLRDPTSPEVERLAGAESERVEFFQYLEWEADRQLGEAAAHGVASGLSIGLYRDLAVGVDPHGGEAWAEPALLIPGAAVGAPPDLLNLKGQDWGLSPPSPVVLRQRAYAPFIAALRANMRHAGTLRIDHVMALRHLYWIPKGAEPADGSYVEYPFEDLVRIVALESQRNRCAVIGEDLGTVPEGFRERLQKADVLSYRVLFFERSEDGAFLPPSRYPSLAAATVTTHDIGTLAGWWLGRDIEWRERLDLYPDRKSRIDDRKNRVRERRLLLDALVAEGVLAAELVPLLLPREDAPVFRPELIAAVHRYLGLSPSRLMLVQLEDVLGETEQVNLPGTVDEHPNWRRRLPESLEELLHDPWLAELTTAINEAREAARQLP